MFVDEGFAEIRFWERALSGLFLMNGFLGYEFEDRVIYFHSDSHKVKELAIVALIDIDEDLEAVIHFRVQENGAIINLYEILYKEIHNEKKPTTDRMLQDVQRVEGLLTAMGNKINKIHGVFGI